MCVYFYNELTHRVMEDGKPKISGANALVQLQRPEVSIEPGRVYVQG